MNKEREQYTEVWGDTVDLKELFISCLLGIILTMTAFLIGRGIFTKMEGIDPALANGYSLLVGIIGMFLAAGIAAKLFKPKRIIQEESPDSENIEDILRAAGMTLEEEIEALSTVDPEIIKELEELELYSLLSLIPEDSPNYKPEYRQRFKKE